MAVHLVSEICWAHIQVFFIFIASILQIINDDDNGNAEFICDKMIISYLFCRKTGMGMTFSWCLVVGRVQKITMIRIDHAFI